MGTFPESLPGLREPRCRLNDSRDEKYPQIGAGVSEPCGGGGVIQFGQALTELNIDIICANSPATTRLPMSTALTAFALLQ